MALCKGFKKPKSGAQINKDTNDFSFWGSCSNGTKNNATPKNFAQYTS